MSFLGRLMSLYPAAVIGLAAASVSFAIFARSPWGLAALAGALYLFPLLSFRLHQLAFPIVEGGSHLVGKGYSAWWGGHQIQLVYFAFPALEAALRLVPGLYSLWLRAWGSSVGRSVYWTPMVEIADRSLMEIGDRVIFGHRVSAYAHIIKPTRKNLLLYVKRIRIGEGCFVGAGTVIAPGVTIPAGSYVAAGSELHPNVTAEG